MTGQNNVGGWRMPPEWAPHERTWMAWPSSGYTLGDTVDDRDAARRAWASVANAVVEFEPVSMLCEQRDLSLASQYLDSRVELIEAKLDDAWARDIGPTFVKNEAGEVAAVRWVFNGWGQAAWASWKKDRKIGKKIAKLAGVEKIESPLINEGGGIHVNENGDLLLTETVQLGEGRNEAWTKAEVEAELHLRLGTNRAIWIRRGLTRDYDEFGTRGHIDIVACFAPGNKVLVHDQQNPEHPDFAVSHEVIRTLEEAGGFEIVRVPAPKILRDQEGFVDYSYINHYLVNGGVILCAFEDDNDQVAKEILESVYPGRKVVLVNAREIFARGGGIHCVTQQQPA
jgi:agmatine deiminase